MIFSSLFGSRDDNPRTENGSGVGNRSGDNVSFQEPAKVSVPRVTSVLIHWIRESLSRAFVEPETAMTKRVDEFRKLFPPILIPHSFWRTPDPKFKAKISHEINNLIFFLNDSVAYWANPPNEGENEGEENKKKQKLFYWLSKFLENNDSR